MANTNVLMKHLLESGVHFGHQTRRWNPKMSRYIFTERNGIHIIDLQKTVRNISKALSFVREVTSQGGKILFVGTKKQAKLAISEEAKKCGMPYVDQRWLGGTLTNFKTIKPRIDYLNKLEAMEKNGEIAKMIKKEQAVIRRELFRLRKFFGGISHMSSIPDALFVVDIKREESAVKEAKILNIPIIAILDTNCDPDNIDFPIPGNDDAIRAVKLISSYIANACIEGQEGKIDEYEKEDETEEK